MEAIKIEGLTKKYKDIVAVDELSLSVQKGELLSLLGESDFEISSVQFLYSGNAFCQVSLCQGELYSASHISPLPM